MKNHIILAACFVIAFFSGRCFGETSQDKPALSDTTITAIKYSTDPDKWAGEHTMPYPGEPEEFFKEGIAVIKGEINGYDPDICHRDLRIIYNEPVTSLNNSFTTLIGEDGKFEFAIPLSCPGYVWFGSFLNVYLEPGRELEILFDAEDILLPEFRKGKRKCNVRFGGELGSVNTELYNAPKHNGNFMYDIARSKTSMETAALVNKWHAERVKQDQEYISTHNLLPVTVKLISADTNATAAYELLDNEFYTQLNSSSESVLFPDEYFALLREFLSQNSKWMIANRSLGSLSNRLGTCESFMRSGFMDKQGMPLTDGAFNKQQSNVIQFRPMKNNAEMAPVMKAFAGTEEPPVLWQIAAASQTNAMLRNSSVPDASLKKMLEENLPGLTEPFIRNKSIEYLDMILNRKPYPLPEDSCMQPIRDIMARHKGKTLLIDFWATTCGPCLSMIKMMSNTLKANRFNPDFKFVFITATHLSPEKHYAKFVDENLKEEETIRLETMDFVNMTDRFKLQGYPHYVLIGPDGTVLDDNFNIFTLNDSTTLKQNNISIISPL